jgi:hypothetical protein
MKKTIISVQLPKRLQLQFLLRDKGCLTSKRHRKGKGNISSTIVHGQGFLFILIIGLLRRFLMIGNLKDFFEFPKELHS